jgi:hypothetical protein
VGIGVRITCLARPKFLIHIVCDGLCDPHTVKPWLSARLGPLTAGRDLKDAGFPLHGGRLGRRPTMALYRCIIVTAQRANGVAIYLRSYVGRGAIRIRSEQTMAVTLGNNPLRTPVNAGGSTKGDRDGFDD